MFLNVISINASARHSSARGVATVRVESHKRGSMSLPMDLDSWEGQVFKQEGREPLVLNPEVPLQVLAEVYWRLCQHTTTWYDLPKEVVETYGSCLRPHVEYENILGSGEIRFNAYHVCTYLKNKGALIPKWLKEAKDGYLDELPKVHLSFLFKVGYLIK